MMTKAIGLAVLGLALAGCAANKGPATPADPALAREVTRIATTAAVAKPGAKVCREIQVGIAERDWVRGTVLAAAGGRVSVRIDDAGRFPHTLHGVKVQRGAVVADDPVAWTPCL